jgi:hypothetical protein
MPCPWPRAIVQGDAIFPHQEASPMELTAMATLDPESQTAEEALVHEWRAERLRGLGLPRILADMFADVVDWHELAALVGRGCPVELALRIVR